MEPDIVNPDNNPEILFEVKNPGGNLADVAGVGEYAIKLTERGITHLLATIRTLGTQLSEARNSFKENPPDEFEVSFSLRFSAEGNIFVSKATGEGQIAVKIVWKNK
jgi:hypothetical protein